MSLDRKAFQYFWIATSIRSGVCSCGEQDGHAGWLGCLQNDYNKAAAS